MKKLWLGTLVLPCLFSLQLLAESPATQIDVDNLTIENTEQYAFVGVEYAYMDLQRTLESEEFYFADPGQSLFGLRVGFQNNVWRTMFTYEDNFTSFRAFLVEADRTILAGMMEGKGRIYLGASGGWIEYYGDRTILDESVEFEDYGYAYGVNVGFMYYITDRIDLSLEYRYLFTSSSYTLDVIQGPGIALHYFF